MFDRGMPHYATALQLLRATVLLVAQSAAFAQTDVDIRVDAPLQSRTDSIAYTLSISDCSSLAQIEVDTAHGVESIDASADVPSACPPRLLYLKSAIFSPIFPHSPVTPITILPVTPQNPSLHTADPDISSAKYRRQT